MDVCFSGRVSNRKQSTVTAVASQEFMGFQTRLNQYWLLVPTEKNSVDLGLYDVFWGKADLIQKEALGAEIFKGNLKKEISLEEYRDRNDRGISACRQLPGIKLD